MAVDLLLWVAVQTTELVHEVLASRLPVGWVALEVGKAVIGDGIVEDFLLEEIHLVEEEDEC